MNLQMWVTLIISILVVLFAFSWAALFTQAKSLWSKLKQLKADYDAAVADGTVTDAEKTRIADDLMAMIGEFTNIFQMLASLVFQIGNIIKQAKILKAQRSTIPPPDAPRTKSDTSG